MNGNYITTILSTSDGVLQTNVAQTFKDEKAAYEYYSENVAHYNHYKENVRSSKPWVAVCGFGFQAYILGKPVTYIAEVSTIQFNPLEIVNQWQKYN